MTVLDTAPAMPPAARSLKFSKRSEEAAWLAWVMLLPLKDGAQSVL